MGEGEEVDKREGQGLPLSCMDALLLGAPLLGLHLLWPEGDLGLFSSRGLVLSLKGILFPPGVLPRSSRHRIPMLLCGGRGIAQGLPFPSEGSS